MISVHVWFSLPYDEDARAFRNVLNSTIATASLSTLSPNTMLYRSGSRLSSGFPKIERVATGSTAEINAPKSRASSGEDVSIWIHPSFHSEQ
jgi:hypothetical protein